MNAPWLDDLPAASNPPVGCSGSYTGEDPLLRALLPLDPVVYVDIGAAEPEECNNTWQFYKAGGYGLLVEPLPQRWPALLRQRPRDHLWPTAVGQVGCTAALHLEDNCSSLHADWSPKDTDTMRVEVVPMCEVLALHPDIRAKCNFCDIDVEGHEYEVLMGIDWDVFQPDVICIEYVDYHPEHRGKEIEHLWDHVILTKGYDELIRTPGNIIYGRGNIDFPVTREELRGLMALFDPNWAAERAIR